MNQLIPWIDANFRTYAEYDGRAVSGFSMGGFGALKYTAKYYGHFASVSAHSGPASLRRDGGLVVHWANTSSAFAELNGGTVYGAPFWNEGRVSADNPVAADRELPQQARSSWCAAWTGTSTRRRCATASASSAACSARPASRTSGTSCPAPTSSAATCSSATSTASSRRLRKA